MDERRSGRFRRRIFPSTQNRWWVRCKLDRCYISILCRSACEYGKGARYILRGTKHLGFHHCTTAHHPLSDYLGAPTEEKTEKMKRLYILLFCIFSLTGCKSVAANMATDFLIQNALSPVTDAVWQGGKAAFQSAEEYWHELNAEEPETGVLGD